jgi:malate dehydrogenase (oxaloacetate-decarboxylating)(NADP+)
VQTIIDEGIAKPILIGRPAVVVRRLERQGLRIRPGDDFELIDPSSDARFTDYWKLYHGKLNRQGISQDLAKAIVRTNATVIGALAVERGDADALICGMIGRYHEHLLHLRQIFGTHPQHDILAALNLMVLESGDLFMLDTYVNPNPTAEQIAQMTLLAVEQIRRFGITPRVALLSHSNFGSMNSESTMKMRMALALIRHCEPELSIDGEMHADSAILPELRDRIMPTTTLKGRANLLVMPNLDAANIAFNLVKGVCDGLNIGPILLGLSKPAHILTPSATSRGIVNLTSLAVVEAQSSAG